MRLLAIGIVAVCALSGCAATGASWSEYAAADGAPPPDKARLVFYRSRNNQQYAGRSASIRLDGETSATSCDYAGFHVLDIAPGKRFVTVDLWGTPGTCTLPVEVSANETYYLEIKPRPGSLFSSMAMGIVGQVIESSGQQCGGAFAVELVRKEFARQLLSDLKKTQ
jgi:hypothetical protein